MTDRTLRERLIILLDMDKPKPTVDELEAFCQEIAREAHLESAQHQRNLVIQQGHNLDCIQCGFKDNVVERYLSELTQKPVNQSTCSHGSLEFLDDGCGVTTQKPPHPQGHSFMPDGRCRYKGCDATPIERKTT